MFDLDERLGADTVEVSDLPLCKLLLMKDANYPWLILVPRRSNISEVFELSLEDQMQLMKESSYVAQRLKDYTHAAKINVATLGNIVKQLHIHVVARFEEDLAWPGPVWGKGPAKAYSKSELEKCLSDLKSLFAEKWEGDKHDG
ncbi:MULTISPECIES: HIT domain-containing protein [unclassified Pseudomonas]|uniref:HIT domain-containing protein n=1 Tax=Pseudomonas TaxID=286 RepID=UPI00257B4874|nr:MULTISPECIES: HIT domain-containing protein [unclassified Pseudomonas]